MDRIASALSIALTRRVVDRTNLSGDFDFELIWEPDQAPSPLRSPDAQTVTTGVSLFTAVQEQLGLKLESTKAPVEVLVIDHVEKPTPD
jgi:uncharacterized protein (TIGR03435 family)